ncbi:MAG: protein translocase subunit SecF [Candidatus Fimadaptatus sp.]
MSKFSFTKNFKVALIIPAVIIAVCIVLSLCGHGMNLGIDFTGGSLLTYDMGGEFDVEDVYSALATAGIDEYQVAKSGEGVQDTLQIRLKSEMSDEAHRNALDDALFTSFPDASFITQEYVGAVAGRDLIANAFYSVLIVAACLLIYIAIRFDFRSGLTAVLALLHDVVIMICGMVLFSGMFQANSSFIAAMLTIVGYSINNTIIIFDRIRENQKLGEFRGKPRMELVDASVRQTLTRTINTSITTLITIVLLFILGGNSIREFAFPIIVGIVAGVYSSVMLSGQTWAYIIDHNLFSRKARSAKPSKA